MFEFVRKHTRLFQFILLILILPSFALVGMQGYTSFMDGCNASVATVDGRKITQTEWDAAHRDQIDRMRHQMPNVDPKLLDTPEVKREALEALVRERVMQTAAAKQHLRGQRRASADDVLRAIRSSRFLRNPDGTVNKSLLAAQGMSSQMFVERLRQDLTLRQVVRWRGRARCRPRQRQHRPSPLTPSCSSARCNCSASTPRHFAANIEPTDAEIEAFYKDAANAAQFQLPESAQIQYLVLDLDALKKDVSCQRRRPAQVLRRERRPATRWPKSAAPATS